MFKKPFLVLALILAGAGTQVALGQDRAAAVKPGTITYEMLVSRYHFPVKKNTGNPEKDQQVYASEKKKWVAANQELYRRYNNQGIKSDPEQRKQLQPSFSPAR